MDENISNLLTERKRLRCAMRRIRNSKGRSTLFVARKLGYDDDSTYCRMERGEIKNISVFTLLDFCKLFECTIVHLFVLANMDIFETEIKTWTEFYQSLQHILDKDFERIKKLANPTHKKINRLKLVA